MLAMVLFTTAAPGITMKWLNDYALHSTTHEEWFGNVDLAPATPMEISVTDIYLSELAIWPEVTAKEKEDKIGVDLTPYKLTTPWPEYYALHQMSTMLKSTNEQTDEVYGNCIDSTTKQLVGYFTEDSNVFQFTPVDRWGYGDDISSVTMICLFSILNSNVPSSTNISATLVTDTSNETVNINVAWPAKSWIQPIMEFKSLTATKNKNRISKLDFEFTTDTIGVYSVYMGGAMWSDLYKHSDKKTFRQPEFWCTTGADNQYARHTADAIYITTIITEPIKCRVYFEQNTAWFHSERLSITIGLLGTRDSKISKTIDYPLSPGVGWAYVDNSDADSLELGLYADTWSGTTTSINTNSTIEFKFSKQFDVANLQIYPGQQEYRNFYGCWSFVSTIFVDIDSNSIILKDVSQRVEYLDCWFSFHGSDVFAYDTQARQGSVQIKVDGKVLDAGRGIGNDIPIHLRTIPNLTALPDNIVTENDVMTIVNTFNIEDNYKNHHVTMSRPVMLLRLQGNQGFTEEDMENQIKCKASSPTSSELVDISPVFDPKYAYWTHEFKDLAELETFKIQVQCTRSVKVIRQYGLDITPVATLRVDFFEFIDEKRFYNVKQLEFAWEPTQPSKQTGTYPDASRIYQLLTASFAVPNSAINNINSLKTDFKTIIENNLTVENAKVPHKAIGTSSVRINEVSEDDSGYYNLKAIPLIVDYIINIINDAIYNASSQFEDHPLTTTSARFAADRWGIYGLFDSTYAIAGSVTQLYELTVEKDDSDWYSVDWQNAAWETTKAYIRDDVTVLNPSSSPFQSNHFVSTPIEGCGWVKGLSISSENVANGYDFKPATTDEATVAEAWQNFVIAFQDSNRILCNQDDACTINADCSAGLTCSMGTCKRIKRYEVPFLGYQDMSPDTSMEFYNTSATQTGIIAIIATIIVALMA